MFAPKIGMSGLTGQTCGSHRSDRCGQCPQNTIWTSLLNRSRRVDQDSYVESPNRSPDEGDTTSARSARRVHGLTGAHDRSDRCPPISSQIEES
jgi:predicted ATP-dependent serine protease